jgi:hypothetical protein
LPDVVRWEVHTRGMQMEYRIMSCKNTTRYNGDLDGAIAKARELNAELQPAYGTSIDTGDGTSTLWDSEGLEGDSD